jgi:hypothetical protein
MPPFRPVAADQAGPNAVGILLPPGRRTVVVVRPRALAVDLVLARSTISGEPGPGFLELPRGAAAREAQQVGRALLRCAEDGTTLVKPVAAPEEAGYWAWVQLETFGLVACSRTPGEPYRPEVYSSAEELEMIAAALRAVLAPGADSECELYTNAQHFGR